MKRVGRLYNTPIVEGDPNEVKGEILITRDSSTGDIASLQKRDTKKKSGEFEDVVKNTKFSVDSADYAQLALLGASASSGFTVCKVYPLTLESVTISRADIDYDSAYIAAISKEVKVGFTTRYQSDEDFPVVPVIFNLINTALYSVANNDSFTGKDIILPVAFEGNKIVREIKIKAVP